MRLIRISDRLGIPDLTDSDELWFCGAHTKMRRFLVIFAYALLGNCIKRVTRYDVHFNGVTDMV
jgi:hypothetical protein